MSRLFFLFLMIALCAGCSILTVDSDYPGAAWQSVQFLDSCLAKDTAQNGVFLRFKMVKLVPKGDGTLIYPDGWNVVKFKGYYFKTGSCIE